MDDVHSRMTVVRIVQSALLIVLLWLLIDHLAGVRLTHVTGNNTRWLLPFRAEALRWDISWRNSVQRAIYIRVLQPLAAHGAYDRALQVCTSAVRLDVSGIPGAGTYYCEQLRAEKAMFEYCSMHCEAAYCQQIFADMCG